MSRVAETSNHVNSSAAGLPTKSARILELFGRSLTNRQIAERVGVCPSYVRAVRSRYSAPDADAFQRRWGARREHPGAVGCLSASPRSYRRSKPALGYRPNPTGQPREELRELALILYRMRQLRRVAS